MVLVLSFPTSLHPTIHLFSTTSSTWVCGGRMFLLLLENPKAFSGGSAGEPFAQNDVAIAPEAP